MLRTIEEPNTSDEADRTTARSGAARARACLTAAVLAVACAASLSLTACSPAFLGGAAVGAAGAGAAYEYENSKELRELERAFERGEISKEEYLERKIFLDLHVRVERGWREDPRLLAELGHGLHGVSTGTEPDPDAG